MSVYKKNVQYYIDIQNNKAGKQALYFLKYILRHILYFKKYNYYFCEKLGIVMKQLFAVFYRLLENLNSDFERYLANNINWNNRLIAITGARGSGKITLLLQYIKKKIRSASGKCIVCQFGQYMAHYQSFI
jgi:hypothetical protein